MSSLQEIKAEVDQISPSILSEGEIENVRMSKLGQIFTADWKQRLALAGRVFTLDLGTISGEASYTALTGNAAYDNNQPEFIIANDTGFLIPLEIDIGISVNDMDAYNDFTQIVVAVDRTQTAPAGETGSIEVALNCLDGGPAFAGRCYSIITGDTSNAPASVEVLASAFWELTIAAAEAATNVYPSLSLYKKFDIPKFIAGPAHIVGYVVGTMTPTFMGSVTFAHIPASWVPTS